MAKKALVILALVLCLPLAAAAADSTVNFQAGDVISAEQFNDIFGHINQRINGYATAADLEGSYSCSCWFPADLTGSAFGTPDPLFFMRSGQTESLVISDTGLAGDHYGQIKTTNFHFGDLLTGGETVDFLVLSNYLITPSNSGKRGSVIKRRGPYSLVIRTLYDAAAGQVAIYDCVKSDTPPVPPTPPANLTATVTADYKISLSWEYTGGTKVAVYRKTLPTHWGWGGNRHNNGNHQPKFTWLGNVEPGVTTFLDNGVVYGGMYLYRIIPVGAGSAGCLGSNVVLVVVQ